MVLVLLLIVLGVLFPPLGGGGDERKDLARWAEGNAPLLFPLDRVILPLVAASAGSAALLMATVGQPVQAAACAGMAFSLTRKVVYIWPAARLQDGVDKNDPVKVAKCVFGYQKRSLLDKALLLPERPTPPARVYDVINR